MENKIKHFIVDLEDIGDGYSYDSEEYQTIKQIRELLNKLIDLINNGSKY